MKDTLLALHKLAEIDSKLDRLKDELTEIPNLAKENARIAGDLQTAIDEQAIEQKNLQDQKNEITSFLTEKEEWVKQREERASELKTNKEYQASLKEISGAKKEIKDKQAELDELNPQLEALDAQISQLKTENEPQITELKESLQSSSTRFEALKIEIANETKVRNQIVREFTDAPILRHYERIHARVSPAMARAIDGICSECGTRLLPQVFNLIAVGEKIQSCNSCRRILFIDETLTQE